MITSSNPVSGLSVKNELNITDIRAFMSLSIQLCGAALD
jgi:hypothetical protein